MKLQRTPWSLLLTTIIAIPVMATPYEDMAKELTRDLGAWSGKRAAVVPFRYADGRASDGGSIIAASLETEIVRLNVLQLVERAQLDKVFAELNWQYSGFVPEESAQKLGEIAGAELLITGTMTDLDKDKVEVQAKLIRVQTGEILRAASSKIKKTWDSAPPAPTAPSGGPTSPAMTTPESPPPQPGIRVTVVTPAVRGAVRRVGDRDLAFRMAYEGKKELIRITDYTDREKPVWTEVEHHPAGFSANFSLAGRKYRIWVKDGPKLRVAPRQGMFGVEDQHMVLLDRDDVRLSWEDDVAATGKILNTYDYPRRSVYAYFEPAESGALRISLLTRECGSRGGWDNVCDTKPIGPPEQNFQVLRGRPGKTVVSNLLSDGVTHYRFRYSSDAQDVVVEEVR